RKNAVELGAMLDRRHAEPIRRVDADEQLADADRLAEMHLKRDHSFALSEGEAVGRRHVELHRRTGLDLASEYPGMPQHVSHPTPRNRQAFRRCRAATAELGRYERLAHFFRGGVVLAD